MYVIKGNRENKPQLSGEVIIDADQEYDMDGVTPMVSMQMNSTVLNYGEKELAEELAQLYQ